jgi:hypothetical protein
MLRVWLGVAVIGVLLSAGCKPAGPDYKALNLVSVTGQVTIDGRPLADVIVRFEGPPGRFAEGKTDAAGNFRLMYDSNQPGCTRGAKVVRITLAAITEEGYLEESPLEGADGQVVKPVQAIPAAYNTASILTADVSPENPTFRFELKSRP